MQILEGSYRMFGEVSRMEEKTWHTTHLALASQAVPSDRQGRLG